MGHIPGELGWMSFALAVFTPEAFSYWLPAFLEGAIIDPDEGWSVVESLLFRFLALKIINCFGRLGVLWIHVLFSKFPELLLYAGQLHLDRQLGDLWFPFAAIVVPFPIQNNPPPRSTAH